MLPGTATRELLQSLSQAGLTVSNTLTGQSAVSHWRIPVGQELLVSTDTLISGVHFPIDETPEAIAYKSLAVNLSDIAAMGGRPLAVGVVLSVPGFDSEWLSAWVKGFVPLAHRYDLQLSHAEVLTGELLLHIQIYGAAGQGAALRRSTARVGDHVCVTGTLGDGACGLKILQAGSYDRRSPEQQYLVGRLQRPEPRIEAGECLVGQASSCIDISDGLLADLGHICTQSGVGAELMLADLPLSDAFRQVCGAQGWQTLALCGGDDYELCFTLASDKLADAQQILGQQGTAMTGIGRIVQEPGISVYDKDHHEWKAPVTGYDHFGTAKT